MDFKQSLDYRYGRLYYMNKLGDHKYNYELDGLLTKALPKILFKGNPTLVAFLQLIDMQLIGLANSIRRIKQFKHISSY